MDNADCVINNDYTNFRSLISVFLFNCKRLKIMVTSQKIVGGGIQNITEKIYELESLDKKSSAKLLELRAPRFFEKDEI